MQVVAGAALVETCALVTWEPHPYDRVVIGLVAYLAVVGALEAVRHRLTHLDARHRVWSVPNLVVSVLLLALLSCGIATLRLLIEGPGHTPRSAALVLFGVLLVLVASLLARVERKRVTAKALTEAAVAMPWPAESIDERLCSAARAGVQAAHERQMQTAITTDELTGLWTFRYFREVLQKAFQQRNPHEQIAVFFLDLDNFKQLNEAVGHLTADRVVAEVGQRLLTQLPVDSFPARFGGDEFVLMMRNVHGPGHCESLRHLVAQIIGEPMTVDGAVFKLSATSGLAVSTDPEDEADPIIAAAERDMRGGKATGRSLLSPRWLDEINLVREVVDCGGIDIALQPIIDLDTDAMLGYEALVRATHPDIGRLSPVQTIASAMRLGILDEVSEMVAERAIDTVATLARATGRRLTLSINIEYQQLYDDNRFLEWIEPRVGAADRRGAGGLRAQGRGLALGPPAGGHPTARSGHRVGARRLRRRPGHLRGGQRLGLGLGGDRPRVPHHDG